MILPRRSFLAGIASALAAPAIVRAESLMPVRTMIWTPAFTLAEEAAVMAFMLQFRYSPDDIVRTLRSTPSFGPTSYSRRPDLEISV